MNERQTEALKLRDGEGMQFGEIGKQMGITPARARQIYLTAKRHENKSKLAQVTHVSNDPHTVFSLLGFPEKAITAFLNANISTVEKLKELLTSGVLKPGKIRGYGPTNHRRVCEILKLKTEPKPKQKAKLSTLVKCPHCHELIRVQLGAA
jgi:hypothetical protein